MTTVRSNFGPDVLSLAKSQGFAPDKIVCAHYGEARNLVSVIIADAGDVFPILKFGR